MAVEAKARRGIVIGSMLRPPPLLAIMTSALLSSCVSPPSGPPAAVTLSQMERVADWQLANPAKHPRDGWVQAAGYTGMMALAEISRSARFHDAMMKMGAGNQWKPAGRVYHADDHCVAQTYLAL